MTDNDDWTPSEEDWFEATGYTVMVWQGWYDTEEESRAAWDRWLDTVKAEAWEEGLHAGWDESGEGWNGEYPYDAAPSTPNPYKENRT